MIRCRIHAALVLTLSIVFLASTHADEKLAGIACRSVHLGYPAADGMAFYNEMTVTQSAEGSYFMACGFRGGYFGSQELANGKKVILFSIWDPGKQDDPKSVADERRVKIVQQGEKVRIGRFGGEGTGGQCFFDHDWQLGETQRFFVQTRLNGDRTEYSGFYYLNNEKKWHHLVTFSTLAEGKQLGGYYSFIEDFRRNRVSATKPRVATFGNGWVQGLDGHWLALTKARFTADSNPATNINAKVVGDRFLLATGGDTKNEDVKLREFLYRPPGIGIELPSITATPRTPPLTGQQQPQLQAVEDILVQFMQKHKVPGAALAIAKDGKLVYARGCGYADVGKQEPVQPTSLFRIASISKPITQAAILWLVENKQLKLDDKVFDVLELEKSVAAGKTVDERWRKITIEHLLEHQGGFDRGKSGDPMFKTVEVAAWAKESFPPQIRSIIRFQLEKPLDFEPGAKTAYSNFGYSLLGRVIEKRSGLEYDEFVRIKLLEPIGITNMTLGKTLRTLKGEVRYYDGFKRKAKSVFPEHNGEEVDPPYGKGALEVMDSHGGWIASAPDLVRFASAIDFPDKFPVFAGELFKSRFKVPYGHSGGLDGTSTFLKRSSNGVTWALLFNSQAAPGVTWLVDGIRTDLENALLDVKDWPMNDLFVDLGYVQE